MTEPTVLLPMRLPTQRALRAAVASIIRDVQRDHGETDQCTADRVGISIGTVRNARNETADLNALTIAKIGAIYGEEAIRPYAMLYRSAPVACDPLADIARAMSTICDMRRADSRGGSSETPKERFDALPTLKAALASMTAYVAGIERDRMKLVGAA